MNINNRTIIKEIFNKLLEIEKEVYKIKIKKINNNNLVNYEMLRSIFIPSNIRKFIIENKNNNNNIKFNFIICNKIISIIFYNYLDKKISDEIIEENIIEKIVILLKFLLNFTSDDSEKIITINIFMTEFKKKIPKCKNKIIGIDNVNNGYSTINNENTGYIVIYRKEEWFKVLIHELFHNLNLDFSTNNISKSVKILSKTFGVDSDYLFFETYCETWARIINVLIESYFKSEKKNKDRDINSFYKCYNKDIKLEREHSLKQASKILNRFENYRSYKENTNVFCYYILTGCLMNDYEAFIEWCYINNEKKKLLKFNIKNNNIYKFAIFIINECVNKKFNQEIEGINKCYIEDDISLKMTII